MSSSTGEPLYNDLSDSSGSQEAYSQKSVQKEKKILFFKLREKTEERQESLTFALYTSGVKSKMRLNQIAHMGALLE